MAMDGLAASDSRRPAATMTRTAAKSARSMVNHQSTSKLRSARDSLMARLAPVGAPPLAPFENAAMRATQPRFSSPLAPAQLDPRQGGHERPEVIAAHLEIGVLVIGGAGRGEQHHRLGGGALARVARCPRQCHGERAATLEGELAAQRRRELLACLTDEVGPGELLKERRQIQDAALFRPSAQDPEDVALEGRERGGGAVGVGGLAVVDEERVA